MDRLQGAIQPYAWGSTTALAEFLGLEPTGKPQAELWLGAHPSAPAKLGDRRLDEVVAEDPTSVLGPATVAEFGPRLPYLMKILAAGEPLSLQAHPTREQAEEGFARENAAGIALDASERTYSDDWPKPEAFCGLGDVEALCGFREPAATYSLFEQLGVAGALELVAPLNGGDADALADVFERMLRLADDELNLVDEVVAAAEELASEGSLAEFAGTATELAQYYPRDPGVLAGLLLNRVAYGRNQAIFLPAGNLHAYLRGIGVEVMANSNNVLRGGLTKKHVDVPELLKLLDFTPGLPEVMDAVEQSPGVFRYPTPAPEFALWRLELDGTALALPGEGTARVVLAAGGTVTLRSTEQSVELSQGQAAFVLAADGAAEVNGAGTLFLTTPGLNSCGNNAVGG
jgi:mannose-6-phosphate isomerase